MPNANTPRRRYPTDLTDAEWTILVSPVPAAKPGGRPELYPKREILNAIRYLLRSGCSWRMLPHDLPPWRIVYHYFRTWRNDGTWARLNAHLRIALRRTTDREDHPSAAIVDSQSVKTTEKGGLRGYDAGKKVNGRKRQLMVDTLGFVLGVSVQAADVQDRDGAMVLLESVEERCPRLQRIWADAGYAGRLVEWAKSTRGWALEIVKRTDHRPGFRVLPRRWVIERTFAWLGRYRRLSKDYEYRTETSEAMIYAAMAQLMARRLAR